MDYIIFTGSTCQTNTGIGGCAFVLLDSDEKYHLSSSAGFRKSTRARMSLEAIAFALSEFENNIVRKKAEKLVVLTNCQVAVEIIYGREDAKKETDIYTKIKKTAERIRGGGVMVVFKPVSDTVTESYWPGFCTRLAKKASETPSCVDYVYEAMHPDEVPDNAGEPEGFPHRKDTIRVRKIRLVNSYKRGDREALVLLNTGDEVAIAGYHGGFLQGGGTPEELQITVEIVCHLKGWLNGGALPDENVLPVAPEFLS